MEGRSDVVEAVLYVDGAPGSGKTRLLVEAAGRSEAVWGWGRPGRGVEAVEAAVALGDARVLVLDDADTRSDVADTLIAWARAGAPGLRLVVAGRVDDVWWPRLRDELPPEVVAALPFQAQVTVPPLVGAAGRSQQQMFTRAMRFFTAEGVAVPEAVWTPVLPPPSVALLHAGAAWAAHTAARGEVSADGVALSVFAAERERWLDMASRAGLHRLPQAVFGEAVVLAALVGASDPSSARQLLSRLPAAVSSEDAGRLADWLRAQYRQRESDWLAPHLPAVMVERYAADLVASTPALAVAVVEATRSDQVRAERALSTLARAARHTERALAAITALLRHDPYFMITTAIAVASRLAGPLDTLVAACLTGQRPQPLTAAQALDLYERIPGHARRHLLGATTVTLMRLYLTHPAVDPDSVDALGVRDNLAALLYRQGRFGEAEYEYEALLHARTRLLGSEHSSTLGSRSDLANVLGALGRFDEAETGHRVVLEARTRLLGPEDVETLDSRSNLANLLDAQGRFDEADTEYRVVLTVQARLLGRDHHETIRSRSKLAIVLYRQGRYGEAEAELGVVLEAQARMLGQEHPETLSSRSNLATVLGAQGNFGAAEAEHRAILEARTRILGPGHPETLSSRNNLATALHEQGRFGEAEVEYREGLRGLTQLLGDQHPDTLNNRGNLAAALHVQGRLDEAEVEYRIVVERQTQILGANHPDTLSSRSNHGAVLGAQGRLDEAEVEYRIVMETQTQILGADHPDTLSSRSNLGTVLAAQGRLEEAEAEHRVVFKARSRLLGAENPYTLRSSKNLRSVLDNRGLDGIPEETA
ncbi:tetratricopeptide repeat protein [Dactylosporangium sp. CA-092794]|uniref:tetratricopeptide repeat protein n=1 Tax=Dactylosporangium sp. CA-092794 TaxID=3239929 RepID=UPI003D941BA3